MRDVQDVARRLLRYEDDRAIGTLRERDSLAEAATLHGCRRGAIGHPAGHRGQPGLGRSESVGDAQGRGADLIVPTRNGTERTGQEAPKALRLDFETLELRDRRGHDLRRTFITPAQVDGARRELLETISHGPRGDIVSLYTTFPWAALCAEVAKLKIELREGELIEFPTAQMPGNRYNAVTALKERAVAGGFL